MVRHAARRTGVVAIATAKVVLWLSVVVASLVAIGSLGRSRHPRYPDLEAVRRSTAQLERNRQALEASIRQQQRVDQLVRDLRDRELRVDPPTPPPALRPHR